MKVLNTIYVRAVMIQRTDFTGLHVRTILMTVRTCRMVVERRDVTRFDKSRKFSRLC